MIGMYFIVSMVALLQHRISCEPDQLSFTNPQTMTLQATFRPNYKVSNGNEILPSAATSKPTLKWKVNPSSLYTVMIIDPDAPSRKNPWLRDYLHWLVVNVPGNNVNRGKEIASYTGPKPPIGTGVHRYYLLVFKQTKNLSLKKIESRAKFNTANFVKKYGLGKAIARNFFTAKYEA